MILKIPGRTMMLVMAIDPGNVQTAWTVMDHNNRIIKFAKEDNYIVLHRINTWREKLSYAICEMIAGYGQQVGKSIYHTCIWIGMFKKEFMKGKEKPADFFLVYRKTVATFICESPMAKDGDVRQAMIDEYGDPGTKKHPGKTYGITKDIWQSLGIAHYFVELRKHNLYPKDIEQEIIDEYYRKIEERKTKAKKNARKKAETPELSGT